MIMVHAMIQTWTTVVVQELGKGNEFRGIGKLH